MMQAWRLTGAMSVLRRDIALFLDDAKPGYG